MARTVEQERRSARTGLQLTNAEKSKLVELCGMLVDAELDVADGLGEDRDKARSQAIGIAARTLDGFGVTRTDIEMHCKRYKIE